MGITTNKIFSATIKPPCTCPIPPQDHRTIFFLKQQTVSFISEYVLLQNTANEPDGFTFSLRM